MSAVEINRMHSVVSATACSTPQSFGKRSAMSHSLEKNSPALSSRISPPGRRTGSAREQKPLSYDAKDGPVFVSIIISTYNACQLVADCLTSIHQKAPAEPYEIIGVDDA